MPPVKHRVGVRRADRIAMAALAVDMRARVFGDRVVASQENGTSGREVIED